MDRRRATCVLVCLGGALVVAPARSQQARPRRIGALSFARSTDPEVKSRTATFEDALAKLGWRKGTNLLIDYRFAEGDESRLVPLAKQALELQPELVLAFSEAPAAAFRQVTLSLPIVFVQVADPIAAGFVTNLARPEGNITGFTHMDGAIGAKWLQALKECAPKGNRIAIVFDPTNPAWRGYVRSIEAAARNFGVTLSPLAATSAAELETGITAFASSPNGALVVLPGAVTTSFRAVIISLAARHGLPAIYPYNFHTAAGGLMSYGVDLADLYRGAASYVDRILKGAKPADLPIQQPTRFEFTINLKTAKALGITIPRSLLQQADKVIQ